MNSHKFARLIFWIILLFTSLEMSAFACWSCDSLNDADCKKRINDSMLVGAAALEADGLNQPRNDLRPLNGGSCESFTPAPPAPL